MKLNVGCGLDVREGWCNIDIDPALLKGPVRYGNALHLGRWEKVCDTVLLNHVLHQFDYDGAEKVLDECVAALSWKGSLIVVEADVLEVAYLAREVPGVDTVEAVLGLIGDDIEPTPEGKLLRWMTWHGTRRSMWCIDSLTERLARRGLHIAYAGEGDSGGPDIAAWAHPRMVESFVVVATRT